MYVSYLCIRVSYFEAPIWTATLAGKVPQDLC